MNRRTLAILTVVSCALSGLVFLVPAQEPAAAQEAILMKIATIAPEGTPWEKQLRRLKTHIEQESHGRIRVQLFMGGSLGGEKALVRRTAQGTLQCFGGSTAALGTVVRELDVIEAPFLFDNAAQADAVLDGPARPLVSQAVARRGFVFGIWAENGFRSWFTRERPIRTPADLQGLRMRSQESEVHLAMYRAFGATPNAIDATNVLTSLQTGVVDGFDNTPLFAFATSWYQAAHHLTLSEHSYQPGIVVYSKTWFDGLPQDLQQVLTNIPAEITADGRDQVRRMDPVLLRNLERQGIAIVRPDAAQREAFARIGRPVQETAAARGGAGGRALLKALRQRPAATP
ncbi:MAG: TRAP transporter substrate-binding protein [Sandaracinaceae bacterium]|nr:TRAP transporter substrate-binding protein [Sandaracinaceae bacterium]